MAIRRRLGLSFSVLLVLLFSLASTTSTAVAQGPGGFKPAGNYNNTSMLGSFFYNDAETSIFVFANRQQTVGRNGTTDDTTLSLNVAADFGALNVNCFIDDSSGDFNVRSDVQSASLQKTITPDTPGCDGTVTSDVVVNLTWTGAGPIQSTRNSNQFNCLGYRDESQGTDSNNAGSATFNITGLTAPITPTDAQVFHFGSSIEHAQGAVPPDSCRGGVGRGAGRPTPAAGNYHTTFQAANTNFFSSDGETSLFLFVSRNTSTSNPLIGVSTSTDETDLSFNLFTPTGNVGGCFVLNTADFTLGASTASVHTVLTSTTPACFGATNFISPDPFPIDVSWAGTAPVATTRSNAQYACLNYHFQTSTVQVVDNLADAQVSMPGLSDRLPSSSTVGSIDTRTHADGTPASGCFFRG
jgi:hypothetical protein